MFRDEEGASMVEYALLVVLIAIIAVIAISIAGEAVRDVFEQVPPALDGSVVTNPPVTVPVTIPVTTSG